MSITARERPAPGGIAWYPTWFAAAGLGGLLLLAGLLVARRLASALSQPLPAVGLVAFVAAVGLVAIGARWAIGSSRLPSVGRLAAHVAVSLAVVGIAVATWLPGTSHGAFLASAAMLLAEEMAGWRLAVRPTQTDRPARATLVALETAREPAAVDQGEVVEPAEPLAVVATVETDRPLPGEWPSADADEADGSIAQQLTRRRTPEGADELSGWLHVDFAPGQRTENAHLAFCPAFARAPRLDVDQVAGPPARIKTAQRLPYGARIDLKRSTDTNIPGRVTLRIVATDGPRDDAAGS
jgi:hypothetical protein